MIGAVMDVLDDLERKVEAAAKTIERLGRENKSLKAKLKKAGGDGAGKASWTKERRVVQQRLGKLAEHLDELL